jgi:hypothetical protein
MEHYQKAGLDALAERASFGGGFGGGKNKGHRGDRLTY